MKPYHNRGELMAWNGIKWYCKAIVKNHKGEDYHGCGSDYTHIIPDLKTLRGVLRRIKDTQYRKNVIRVDICRGYDSPPVHSFKPTNFMTF